MKSIDRWLMQHECEVEGITDTDVRFRLSFMLDGGASPDTLAERVTERVQKELRTGFHIERWSVEYRR